jgi:ABC-type sulfate/molybdate transport systems ATPase subunit
MTTAAPSSFELRDVQLRRRGGFALGPLDLRIATTARTALVGPSGSGKTTLLRLLAGLEVPERGQISHAGTTLTDGQRLLVSPAQRRIGFVFQDGALWPHLDAIAHLRFVDPRLDVAGARALLQRVGLTEHDRRKPHELSGGERQRLALARALAGQPQILLLDEPLHSVDVHLRDELALLIRGVAQERGLGLVVVTHDRRDAFALASELVVLHSGKVIEQGDAATLAHRPRTAFTAAFLGGATCIPLPASAAGRIDSPFGPLEAPSRPGAHVLAVFAGDVTLAERAPTRGRVLRVVPDGDRSLASVQLASQVTQHVIQVHCQHPPADGSEVGLELQQPRILPVHGGEGPQP